MNNELGICSICDRKLIKNTKVDKHHLIPKSKNGQYGDTILIHRICHEKIHSLWTEAELAGYYNTSKRIKENSEMKKFIKWVKKKPECFYSKTKMANSRHR